MIVFPNCKINLGLHVLRKRSDCYHDIETVFFPVPYHDVLEIVPLPRHERTSSFPLQVSGIEVPGSPANNLCVRAYKMLKKEFPSLPKIKMHLHKRIPSGAGLGGGSSNGAFALQLLNQLFKLDIGTGKMLQLAAELGSDCPFFILNRPCLATGRGEVLQEVRIDLSSYKFIIVNPRIHIDTGMAFANITPAEPEKSIIEIISLPPQEWRNKLINDFEKPVFTRYPEIAVIKQQLYDAGAIFASMSGSGSTVYGIFPKDLSIKPQFPPGYFVKQLSGRA